VALKPSGSSEEEEMEAAALYFKVFDVDGDGLIGENELELVLNCLLHDGAGPLLVNRDGDVNTVNIRETFFEIDTNNDGMIDFEEFKTFYNTVLLPSTVAHHQGTAALTPQQETGGD
jgi:Ca2+-binding EF-hand superfamily protein